MAKILVRADLLQGSNTAGTVEVEGGPSPEEFTLRVDYSMTLNPSFGSMQTFLQTFPIGTTKEQVTDAIMASTATFPGSTIAKTTDPSGDFVITVTANSGNIIGHLDWGYTAGTSAPASTVLNPTAVGGCPINYIQPTTEPVIDNTTIPAIEACDGGPRRYGY